MCFVSRCGASDKQHDENKGGGGGKLVGAIGEANPETNTSRLHVEPQSFWYAIGVGISVFSQRDTRWSSILSLAIQA